MSRANESAFPTPHFTNPNGDIQWGCPGLTIREHFAGLAMQSVITTCSKDLLKTGQYGAAIDELFAQKAILLADALIAELAKPIETPLDTNGNPVQP